MKRSWILNTMAVVVILTVFLAFTSGNGNFFKAGAQPVKEEITPSQPEKSDSNNGSNKDIKLTESQHKMSDCNNDFACNLFRTISKQKHGSIVISPISVSYLLGMLNEGADGETRRQITDVLGLDGSVEEINKYFKKMIDEAPYVDSTVTIKTANCIYNNSAMHIRLIPQYQADMQKYYDAQVDMLDFTEPSNVDIINRWCDTHTDGMIPKILNPLEFKADAAMYLLNAVYFKATWTTEFDPEETRDMKFTKQDGSTVKRKMMHLETKAAYGKNELCEMLCLPYGNRGYSMYVLLPHKGKTIKEIIQSLSTQKLEQMRHEMTTSDVDVLLPRFTTDSETALTGVLSAMGMPRAFGIRAEFPNMAQDHKDDLFVSMIKQKARIEVEEEGTKAAAVTIAEMSLKCVLLDEEKPKIVEFHAKRPFVYYIIENSTGTIYFMGTYCGN